MRYDKERLGQSRRRIIETASQSIRRHGISATGIATVMKASNLTHGAFYGHFESKEKLVCDAMQEAQDSRLRSLERNLSATGGGMEAAIREYLSDYHVADAATGCTSAALAPEVARSSGEIRATYTRGLVKQLEAISRALPSELQPRVPAVYAMLVGCVQLARACDDASVAETILESGLATAFSLVHRAVEQGLPLNQSTTSS